MSQSNNQKEKKISTKGENMEHADYYDRRRNKKKTMNENNKTAEQKRRKMCGRKVATVVRM